jgi:hypothetical protein
MLDRVGKEAFVMLVAIALGFLLGGPTGAAICFALAATIALVLWTPLRGWLGIKTSVKSRPADSQRIGIDVDGGSIDEIEAVRIRDQDTVIRTKDTQIGRVKNLDID